MVTIVHWNSENIKKFERVIAKLNIIRQSLYQREIKQVGSFCSPFFIFFILPTSCETTPSTHGDKYRLTYLGYVNFSNSLLLLQIYEESFTLEVVGFQRVSHPPVHTCKETSKLEGRLIMLFSVSAHPLFIALLEWRGVLVPLSSRTSYRADLHRLVKSLIGDISMESKISVIKNIT